MKTVYIAGSINTDFVINVSEIPEKGETVKGSDFFTAFGGKGANQAIACARLGANVKMCGCVGGDYFGESAVEALKKDGVDVTHIRTVSGKPTGSAVIIVSSGDNRIILDSGANSCLSCEDISSFLADAEEGDIFLTQLESPIEVIGYGLKLAHEKGLYTVLNPAPADKAIEKYVGYCKLLVPNETESEILGEAILKSVETVLKTLGGDGYSINEKHYPCMKVVVVDTTAAGDTLCGGLCTMLAEGKSLEEAARFGSVAASIACSVKGAQPSIPTIAQVKQALKKETL